MSTHPAGALVTARHKALEKVIFQHCPQVNTFENGLSVIKFISLKPKNSNILDLRRTKQKKKKEKKNKKKRKNMIKFRTPKNSIWR